MHLLNPYAIAWLPLIALLLLVARHRAPRPRRAVSNLYLWRQTTPLDPARLALARFRRHRLLALQIAFMLAVIAALARPVVTGRANAAAATPASPPAAAPASPRASVEPIHVLLLTQGNFFLEQSLVTNPLLAVDRERRAGSRYDVVVCDGCGNAPSDAAGLLTIPAADETAAPAERVTVADSDHPIGAALAALGAGPVLASPAARSSDTVIGGDVVLRAGGVPRARLHREPRRTRGRAERQPRVIDAAAQHRFSGADGINRGMARRARSVVRGPEPGDCGGGHRGKRTAPRVRFPRQPVARAAAGRARTAAD